MGKSLEKLVRKFRLGAASNLNKRNGEAQNMNSVIPSSQHTAAHKNREIWKSRTARRGRSRFSPSFNMACHVENERGLRKHQRTHYGESEMSAGVPSHRRAESWTQTSSNFQSILEVPRVGRRKSEGRRKVVSKSEESCRVGSKSIENRWLVQARKQRSSLHRHLSLRAMSRQYLKKFFAAS